MFLALFLIAWMCVCMFVLLLCALLSVYVSVRLGLSPSCPLLSVSMSSYMHMNVCMHCEYCPHLSSFWSFVSRCLVCLCLCVPVGCGLCGGAGGRVILILLFELYIVQKHLSIPRDHAFTNFFQPLLVLCVIFLSICFHFFSMSNLYLVILIGPHCSV